MSVELRRLVLLSALVVAAAGLAAWLFLREERAAVAPASLPPGASAAAPSTSPSPASANVAPSSAAPAAANPDAGPAPEPGVPVAAGSSEPTTPAMSVDERQDAKIARGLASAAEGGLLVESAPPASVVAALRLQPGDVIVTVNGTSVSAPADFVRLYREQGMPSELTILRAGSEMHLHSIRGAP